MPYSTPSRRGGSAKKPYTPRKRGLFEDGQWLCKSPPPTRRENRLARFAKHEPSVLAGECTPRKPALCLTVKKDSPNKGKRFYTCQDNPKKCDFFLWFVSQTTGISSSPTLERIHLQQTQGGRGNEARA